MSVRCPGACERAQRASHANGAGPGAPASERAGGSGGAKPHGKMSTCDLSADYVKINAEYRT